MFFGDTEHKYIHISEPLLVKFDNVIPQSNNLKSVKLMRLELENDLGKLQKELLHEKNEIRELMKKIINFKLMNSHWRILKEIFF